MCSENCCCEGQTEIFLLGWKQTPVTDGMEEREKVGDLMNIVFCTVQIASTGLLFAMITRLYHTVAVGMNEYVYAKMLSIF